jgi:hypothetical protein
MSNYQPKGRLHAKRFTKKPGNCRVCNRRLPKRRPNSKRICNRCLSDPDRLESQRKRKNEKEQERCAAKHAAEPKTVVVRKCQHKDGEICGIEFEAKPRIGGDGINHGVSPEQKYCPKHQTPKAVARRRWLNRNVENSKRLQREHRKRHLPEIRKKQKERAQKLRDELKTLRIDKKALEAELQELRVEIKTARAELQEIKNGRHPLPIGENRIVMNKPGPTPADERARLVCELYDQGMRWAPIKERVEMRFQIHTTIGALQDLRKRYLDRQKKPAS